ncbi:hemagglutinin repeat-containing protein [Dyella sp. A6]|uniref:hemagglutinin repeat-containing protein n=1 Tax=Dyella aluminiiresistens TaxID=3069105 RepID=UPI002E7A7FB0|nr:hemagglutinin repeat-containing protein [Dyella sp. A6]
MKNANLRQPTGVPAAAVSWHRSLRRHALWAALTLALGVPTVQAQTVTDGGTHTSVIAAPNGVPVVNIAAPNGAGVSHNTYQQFNVGSNGLILNNSGTVSNTRLAGYIGGNLNLGNGQSASLILNEVTSTSPSQLNGAMEVAGHAAQVVVANPNGISCSGCGFINVPRGTLTTGRPLFAGDGSLSGLAVTGGTITIGGNGLPSGSTDQVDLLARAVAINAGVWARQLNVVTGPNRVDYATLATQPLSATGTTPTVALDVSALGGMYANAIRLIGTEAGLGVNSQGEIIAQNGDLTLTSAGQVVLTGKTTATGNVSLTSAQSLTNQGTLAGGGVINLSSGDFTNQGVLYGNNAITLSANGTVGNSGQIEAQSGALTVQAHGAITSIAGSSVYAGGPITLSGASFGNAGTFESAQGFTLQVSDGASNTGSLSADAGNFNLTASTIANTGRFAAGGNAVLNAVTNLTSSGTLVADGAVTLTAPTLSTAGTVQAGSSLNLSGGKLTNDGKLYALNGAWTAALSGGFANQTGGAVYGSQNVTLNAASLTNAGGIEAQQGDAITLTGALTNSGTLQSDQADLALQAASFVNSGTLSAQRNLQLQASGAVQNSGVLVSGQAFNLSSGTFDNQAGGQIQSGTDAAFSGATLSNEGTVDAKGSATLSGSALTNAAGAQWLAAGTLTLNQTGDVSNAGVLQAGGDLSMEHAASLTNGGTLQTLAGNLTLAVDTLTSTGTLGAHGSAVLSASDNLRSTGTLLAGGAITLTAPSLATSGTVQAGSTLGLSGNTLVNSGKLYALGGNWTASLTGAFANQGGGAVYGSQNVTLNAASLTNAGGIEAQQGDAITLTGALTNSGTLQSDQADLALQAASFVNSGTLSAQRNLQLQASGAVQNSGVLVSGQAFNLSSGTFDNQAGGQIQSGTDAAFSGATLSNEGTVDAKGGATLSGSALTNAAGAQWLAAGTLTLNQTGDVSNAGVLQAGGDLSMEHAASFTNGGTLQTLAGNLTLAVGTLTSTGTLGAYGSASLRAGNSFSSAGNLTAGGALSIASAQLVTAGTVEAGGALTLSGGTLSNNGKLYALGGPWTATLSGAFTNQGSGDIYGSQDLTLGAASLASAGGIEARQAAGITVGGAFTNGGTLQSDQSGIRVRASSLTNTGTFSANQALQWQVGDAVQNSGVLVSGQAMTLSSGSFDNQAGGQIQSGTDLALSAVALNNAGTINAKGRATLGGSTLGNAVTGQLIAAGALTVGETGSVSNAGVLQAGSDFTLTQAASLTNAAGATLYAGQDVNLTLGQALTNAGMLYAARTNTLSAGSVDNTGTLRSGNDLSLSSTGDVVSSGAIQAQQSVNLLGGANVTNSGKIYAIDGGLTVQAAGAFGSASTGDIYSGQAIGYQVGSFANAGTLEATQGVNAAVQGQASNSGVLQADHGDVVISANGLVNQGTLSANGNLQVGTSGALANAGKVVANSALTLTGADIGNSGQVQSGGNATLQAAAIDNSGRLQSGGTLAISHNATLTNEAGGQLLAAGDFSADTASLLSNAGVIQSGGNLFVQGTGGLDTTSGSTLYGAALTTLRLGGSFANAGTVYGGQGVQLAAASVGNTGALRSDATLDVTSQGDASNSGTSYAAGNAGWNVAGVLTNTGVLASAADTTLTVGSLAGNGTLAAGLRGDGTLGSAGVLAVTATGSLASQGRALAAGNLDFTGQSIDLTGSQTRAGSDIALSARLGNVVNTGGNLAANGTVSITAPGSLINGGSTAAQGGTISGATLDLTAASLDNRYGTLTQTGAGDLTLAFAGAFENAYGTLASNAGNLRIQAASLDNTGGAIQQAGGGVLTLDANGDLTNTHGRIAGNGALNLQSGGTLANNGGTLSMAGNATVNAVNINDSQGTLIAGTLNATATQAFTNTGGTVQAAGALTLDAGSLDNTGGYIKVTGAQALGIAAGSALTNGTGGFIGGNGDVTLQAGSLTNAGQIYAGQALGATVQGVLSNDGGALQAMGSLSASSGGAFSNRSGQTEAGAGDGNATLGLTAASIDNTGGRIADSGRGSTTVNGQQGIVNQGGTLGGQGAVTLIAASMDNSHGGHLVAGQDLGFTFGGMNNAGGMVYAAGSLTWNNGSASLANAGGNLGAGGDLSLTLQSLDDTGGAVAANGNVALTANTFTALGRVAAGQNLTLTTGGSYTNTTSSQLVSNGNLTLNLGGNFSNVSGATLQAVGTLAVNASSIDNAVGATLNSAATTLTTGGALTNEGSIEGTGITLSANALTNTGNIIGGTLVATAGSLTNGADLGTTTTNNPYQSALIAAANSIDLYVSGTLLNRDATVFTTGDLTIAANPGGGQAQAVTNLSGDIESDGSITLDANQFTNQRRVFQTTTYNLTAAEQAQNTATGAPLARYLATDTDPNHQPPNVTAAQVIGSAEFANATAYCNAHDSDSGRCVGYPNGVGAPVSFQSVSTDTVTSVTKLLATSAQGQLLASGNITLNGSVLNDKSTIAAGNNLIINGQNGSAGGGNTSTATVQNVAWAPTAQVTESTQDQTAWQYLQNSPRTWIDGGWWTYGTTNGQQQISLAPGAAPSWVTYNAGAGLAASMTAGNTVSITAQTINNTVVNASGQPVQAVIGLGANSGAQSVAGSAAGTVANASGTGGGVGSVAVGSAPGQASGGSLGLAMARTIDGAPALGATSAQNLGTAAASAPNAGTPTQAVASTNTAPASASTHTPSHAASAVSGGTAAPAAPQVVSTLVGPNANVRLPQTGLYTVNVQPGSQFLVESNPQFTQYNNFISSNYLLQQLGLNPAATEQRLGDGFYEQQQVLAQITDLTGRRYLADDTDALDQYRDLMNNATDVAKQFDLSVGVALTPAQMASLTQDIVWLVSVTVDGHQVLEPVVYLSAADAKHLAASGATIAGKNVILDASGNISNNGTIAASNDAQLTASNLLNSGTISAGNDLSINAAQNILNGGTLKAGGNVSLVAGNDVLSGVNVAQGLGAVALPGLGTSMGPVALKGLELPGSINAGGNLSIAAGRDLSLDTAPVMAGANLSLAAGRDLTATATAIHAGGDAQLLAGRDLSLLATSSTNRIGTPHNSMETTTHTVGTLTAGGGLTLLAGHDLVGQGAQLTGATLNLAAGHDLNLAAVTDSTTRTTQSIQGHTVINTGQTDQSVRGTALTGTNGLAVAAAHDLTVTAGQLSSANGNVALTAGNDLNLNAAQENHSGYRDTVTAHSGLLSSSKTTTHDATSDSYAIGTSVSGNAVTLAAGHDLTTQAAQLTANDALSLSAGHDVTLGAGEQTHTSEHSETHTSSSLFNTGATRFGSLDPESYSRQSQSSTAQTWSIGSTLSGDTVTVAAGHDLTGTAVQIAGTHDVTLAAGNDLTLDAGKDTYSETDGTKVSRTGLMNGGGFSALIGNRTTQAGTTVQDTSYTGSLVGSTHGAAALTAGHDVHITGSDVLSQTATTIVGQNVTIDAAVGSTDTTQTQSVHTGGIHVGIGGAAAGMAATAYQDVQGASRSSSDSRLKALYAAKAAYDAKDLAGMPSQGLQGASKSNPNGINLQVGIGGSTASSRTLTHDETTYGSAIRSAGDVTIAATNGDLNVIGSRVDGQDVALSASHDLNLLSQAEQHTLKSTNKNASGGVGLQIGTDGIGFYAQASVGQGKAHGNGTTHTDTVVDASNTLSLLSGNDTTIQGAQAKGNTVLADIGHDLDVTSEQDTGDYASTQWQVGGKVVVGMGASASGSASYGKVDSHYASVTQASGIQAGAGGYQLTVGDTTHLVGGQLASTADPSLNLLDTGNLIAESVHNESKYSAVQVSVSGGSGGAGFGGGLSVQNHHASSTTQSGVAAGTVTIRNHRGQDLSGLTRDQSILDANGVKNGFNAQKVAEQQEAGSLAGYVGMRAAGDIEQSAGLQNGSAGAIALHTVVGGAAAALGGGNALQGAMGAGAGEAATPYLESKLGNTGTELATTLVGAVVGGGAGASTALAGDEYNRQLHPDEVQWIKSHAATFAQQQCGCDWSALSPDQQSALTDQATASLTQQALKDVDLLWRSMLSSGDNTAAQTFLASAQGTFTNETGQQQALFTTEGNQYLRPALYADGADVGFYQAYAQPGVTRTPLNGLAQETGGAALQLQNTLLTDPLWPQKVQQGLLQSMQNFANNPVGIVKGWFQQSGNTLGETGGAWSGAGAAELNALYGQDVTGVQRTLQGLDSALVLGNAVGTGTMAGELSEQVMKGAMTAGTKAAMAAGDAAGAVASKVSSVLKKVPGVTDAGAGVASVDDATSTITWTNGLTESAVPDGQGGWTISGTQSQMSGTSVNWGIANDAPTWTLGDNVPNEAATGIPQYTFNAVENPGPLASMPGTPAANFYSGQYNMSVSDDVTTLYRAGSGAPGSELGQWFTTEPPQSLAQVRIDSAVQPQWIDPATGVLTGESPIDTVYGIQFPAGTTMYDGPVGYQGGVYLGGPNTNQIFISKPWNIPGVQVISRNPLQ